MTPVILRLDRYQVTIDKDTTALKPICRKYRPRGGSRIDHDIDRDAAFHDRLIIDAATVVIGGSPHATAWQCGSPDEPTRGSACDPTRGSARVSSACIGFGERHLKCHCGP